MTLTLDEVRKTKFHMARRTGYEVSEVDLFVDRVEASFAKLTEENEMLKQQVEALNQAKDHKGDGPAGASKADRAQPQQVSAQAEQPRPAAAKTQGGDAQKIVVSTAADASPAVVRLVQLATEQAEQLVGEAAAEARRRVDEARQKADQITGQARSQAERAEAEARTRAERTTSDAQGRAADLDRQTGSRRAELFANLERERDHLQDAVAQLRAFEQNYRTTFTGHLKEQLQAVDGLAFEPSAKPALADRATAGAAGREPTGGNGRGAGAERGTSAPQAQGPSGPRAQGPSGPQAQGPSAPQAQGRGSATPRLDALLGENRRKN